MKKEKRTAKNSYWGIITNWVVPAFWLTDKNFENYEEHSAYYREFYSLEVRDFMTKNNLTEEKFRSEMFLCTPQEAKKRVAVGKELAKQKADGKEFPTDKEIDEHIDKLLKIVIEKHKN